MVVSVAGGEKGASMVMEGRRVDCRVEKMRRGEKIMVPEVGRGTRILLGHEITRARKGLTSTSIPS